jgi:hypothetical protein
MVCDPVAWVEAGMDEHLWKAFVENTPGSNTASLSAVICRLIIKCVHQNPEFIRCSEHADLLASFVENRVGRRNFHSKDRQFVNS